jgi:hypothetical protein
VKVAEVFNDNDDILTFLSRKISNFFLYRKWAKQNNFLEVSNLLLFDLKVPTIKMPVLKSYRFE